MRGGAILRGIIARRYARWRVFVRRHGGQKQRIKELLAHQVFGKAEAAGNCGSGLAREMPLARGLPRQQEFARENIRLQFAPLPDSIILDALEPNRGRLHGARGVDVVVGAFGRSCVDTDMSKLVRDEAGLLSRRALVEAADHPALLIKQRAGAFERRIALREPRQLQFKIVDRRRDQLHRLVGISPAATSFACRAAAAARIDSKASIACQRLKRKACCSGVSPEERTASSKLCFRPMAGFCSAL